MKKFFLYHRQRQHAFSGEAREIWQDANGAEQPKTQPETTEATPDTPDAPVSAESPDNVRTSAAEAQGNASNEASREDQAAAAAKKGVDALRAKGGQEKVAGEMEKKLQEAGFNKQAVEKILSNPDLDPEAAVSVKGKIESLFKGADVNQESVVKSLQLLAAGKIGELKKLGETDADAKKVAELEESLSDDERKVLGIALEQAFQGGESAAENSDEYSEEDREKMVQDAQEELKDLDPATMDKNDLDMQMGSIMMKHGVNVARVGNEFKVTAPRKGWEKFMNILLGAVTFVGALVNRLKKAAKGEDEKKDVPAAAPAATPPAAPNTPPAAPLATPPTSGEPQPPEPAAPAAAPTSSAADEPSSSADEPAVATPETTPQDDRWHDGKDGEQFLKAKDGTVIKKKGSDIKMKKGDEWKDPAEVAGIVDKGEAQKYRETLAASGNGLEWVKIPSGLQGYEYSYLSDQPTTLIARSEVTDDATGKKKTEIQRYIPGNGSWKPGTWEKF